MSNKQFEGRSAIVTGGTRGIGKAIALELAHRGCNVAFNYARSAEEAEKLKAEIEGLDVRAFAAQCDVANTEASAEFVKAAAAEFGTIDFLVNNAGITRDQLILRMKEDDWDSVIDTNLKGAWNFSKAVLRPMMKNENGGSIVNITSVSGNITVNALALGLVETEMASEMNAEYREKILSQIPLGRLGNVQETAEIVCFLLSPAAAYITGEVINANGGLAM